MFVEAIRYKNRFGCVFTTDFNLLLFFPFSKCQLPN